MLVSSNVRILAMRRATMFRLHSIKWKLNEVHILFFFFSMLGSVVPPSEANFQLFLDNLYTFRCLSN